MRWITHRFQDPHRSPPPHPHPAGVTSARTSASSAGHMARVSHHGSTNRDRRTPQTAECFLSARRHPRRRGAIRAALTCVLIVALAGPAAAQVRLGPARAFPTQDRFAADGFEPAALNDRGAAVATAARWNRGGTTTPLVRQRPAARGSWSPVTALAPAGDAVSRPVAAINLNGHAIAVFARNGVLMWSRRGPRLGWSPGRSVGAAVTMDDTIRVSITDRGAARIAVLGRSAAPAAAGSWTVRTFDQTRPRR